LLAAQRYDLTYPELKKLARNSLEYSFLEGDSLWQSPQFAAVTAACAEDEPGDRALSPGCASFLAQSDRARVQWQLERDFAEFENLSWF
jgi:adenosine deaminase/adenosine deaminase CECR1